MLSFVGYPKCSRVDFTKCNIGEQRLQQMKFQDDLLPFL